MSKAKMKEKRYGSPNMSDTTLLVSVEDLINMSMGPPEVNVVNFKMVQTVLHILARQLRLLETRVEIRVSEKTKQASGSDSASSKSPQKQFKDIKEGKATSPKGKEREKDDKTKKEKAPKDKERAESKERERADRAQSKDRAKAEKAETAKSKEREKAERAQSKEREKAERDQSKEREKADRAASKEREKDEKAQSKEREKAERDQSKEREKAEKTASKEREKEAKAQSKEREKAERDQSKEREKAEKTASKEREKEDKAQSKEREKAERDQSKEREKAEKTASKEREKEDKAQSKEREKDERDKSKEREKAEKTASKEREKEDKAQSKEREKDERDKSKEREKADKTASKEREKEDKAQSKEREKAERDQSKEREKAEKSTSKEREKQDKAQSKEREKAERDQSKEREQASKEKEKEEKAKRAEDKAKEAALKELEKEERAISRVREKADKKTVKQREEADRAASQEREKAEKRAIKEKEKAERDESRARAKGEKAKEQQDKMDAKEKEKAERDESKVRAKGEKAKEQQDKMDAKEKERQEKEKEKADKVKAKGDNKGRTASKTGISIKEEERQKEKVLIVEKGPTTRTDSRTRVGSIEVVTLSQFELLEAAVKDLKEKAGPLPLPALPDNQKLRSELAKGSASLTDTMQAMQVSARVQAAEAGIERMAGLLTQLAAAGALPQDVAGKLEEVKAEMDTYTEPATKPSAVSVRKAVAIDPKTSKKEPTAGRLEVRPSLAARPSVTSKASVQSRPAADGVTHVELNDALRCLREDLNKNVTNLTTKATAAAELASVTAKAVADKLEIALKLNTRINTLYSLVGDYAEQLSGFDAGLTTQMQSFQEQMAQMRNDLKGGITQLEQANTNSETAAVMELTERYEGLVSELDLTLHAHQTLTAFQKQLGEELRSLLECVEMLREQKADRDEVLDGLRDKADNSRLAGLLTESEFALSRTELERRLDLCYDKFLKQEKVWMGAIKDLTLVSEGKAELMQLLAARDLAQQQLRDIQDKLNKLSLILGEPKAAMVTRQLSRGARCATCLIPALQEPQDISYGKPPLLPAVRSPPVGEEKPCMPQWHPDQPADEREHVCLRWVGGSHTLLAESVVREQAGPLHTNLPPTKKYTGYGNDGRLYMMEEELQPCMECNMISPAKPPAEPGADGPAQAGAGAGDGVTPPPATAAEPKT